MTATLSHSQPMDPRIGMLNSGVYYAFVDGYHKPEFRGTREQVEVKLGLRAEPKALPKPSLRNLRNFIVRVTPKLVSYAGTWADRPYDVPVVAISHNDAIKRVRQERNEVEGRHGVRATYQARVADKD